jgi:hypothetical protein
MTLAAVFTAHWQRYAARNRHHLCASHYRAARAVLACRTSVLGGHVHQCGECEQRAYVYHSCNHRSCSKCGGREQKQWAAAQEAKLLTRVPYFMLTFTIPSELRTFAYKHQAWFYDVMFKAMQQTLHTFAQDEQHLGGTPGYTAVLHTWTRELLHHPHLHVIMPGLALSADGLRVRRAKGRKFLFPVKALGAFFRNRVSELIAARDVAEQTQHHRDIDAQVWTMKWIIDAQGVGRGQSALRYLARYVKKSALSEQRLQGYDEQGNIKLNCQKSGSKQWHIITLTPDEFIRRWSLHVLPQGLMRVRHYGLHSAAAKAKLARVQSILGQRAKPAPAKLEAPKPKCPCCGKDMQWQREIKRAPHWWNALIEHREEQLAATPATGPPPALIITRGQARATSAELTTA